MARDMNMKKAERLAESIIDYVNDYRTSTVLFLIAMKRLHVPRHLRIQTAELFMATIVSWNEEQWSSDLDTLIPPHLKK